MSGPNPEANMTNAHAAASASSSAVKRACDACHRRKVKCVGDGTRPCKNCTLAGLTCTYNAVPQKKGPKGSRAKVISELRETQRQSSFPAGRSDSDYEVHALSTARRPYLVSADLITLCVDYYFVHISPTQPILYRARMRDAIAQMDIDVEAYCLVVSLCAYTLIQPNIALSARIFEGLSVPPSPPLHLGHALVQEVLRVRRGYDFIENPTVSSIITSFFLFGSHFCLDKQNAAWFHLREATTLVQMIGMHSEDTYLGPDQAEVSCRRRLYWLLFITERAYALQQHKPLSLHATINLPSADEEQSESADLVGFLHLVNLYRPFDDHFVGLWNKASSGCSQEWLASLQQQVTEALPAYLNIAETQAADLRCSQQWLRTMIWQLSISQGLLSSAATDSGMSFRYPIEVCRDLTTAMNRISRDAMEVHGIGLVEKLFDVACTLTDVMACVPYEQYTFEFGPRDYLNQLTTLISTLRGGRERYLPLLITKINETVPGMMIHTSTGPLGPNASRLDLISGDSRPQSGSATSSGQSTPFGTPPASSVDCVKYGLCDPGTVRPTMSVPKIMAAGIDYGDMTVTASMAMYHDVYLGAEAPVKTESYG